MAIPSYEQMMLPVLRLIQSGRESIKDCIPGLVAHFGLVDGDINTILPSGGSVLASRASWAKTYLAQAGLVEPIKRGRYRITTRGAEVLARNLAGIDNKVLLEFPEFRAFKTRAKPAMGDAAESPLAATNFGGVVDPVGSETPEDAMASAQSILDSALRDDLLAILKDINPVRFERLILDLLTAMGYGGGDLANAHMTKASGDGGIDGIIHEDKLGLDAVYIQAKRYAPDSKVGRPAIQQFVGSLNGEGATKGVFVTTSDFSPEARGFLGKVQHRIVLINGQELARLMIRHGVGVRDRTTYVVRSVDEDYFSDLNGG